MEDVLEVYHRPYDPDRPQICLDETSKQMVAETRPSVPMEMDDANELMLNTVDVVLPVFLCYRNHWQGNAMFVFVRVGRR